MEHSYGVGLWVGGDIHDTHSYIEHAAMFEMHLNFFNTFLSIYLTHSSVELFDTTMPLSETPMLCEVQAEYRMWYLSPIFIATKPHTVSVPPLLSSPSFVTLNQPIMICICDSNLIVSAANASVSSCRR
jgi:hypothetical protein